jgi:hypothetical protein
LCGDTGSDRELGLDDRGFVIAFVCRFQIILSPRFNNFPTIDDLQQILLDRYERIGLEPGYQDTLRPDHQYRTVKEGSSWEGGGPIQLPYIPLDSTITDKLHAILKFSRDRDGVHEEPTQTCQAIQDSFIFQLIWQGQ